MMKNRIWNAIVVLLLLSFARAALVQAVHQVTEIGSGWSTNTRVNDESGTSEQGWSPAIAVDKTGNAYAIWHDTRNGRNDIYFSYRPVSGSWRPNERVNDNTSLTWRGEPAIAVDNSGNAYTVWVDCRDDTYNKKIYFSYRPAGGSWGPNMRVDDHPDGIILAYQPAIALDSSGNAYVVWDDDRDSSRGPDIYFSYRPAGGSWSPNERVSDDNSPASQILSDIAVDGEGNAYAVWVDLRNNDDGDIYFSYRPAGGSWSPNERINDLTYGRQYAPSITVDHSGNSYAVWCDYYANLRFSFRPMGGNWSSSVRVNDVSSKVIMWCQDIVIDAFGNLYTVWMDSRNGTGDRDIYSSSRPRGGSWTTNLRVNDDQGSTNQEYPAIGVDANGNVYAVWRDLRNDVNGDIYFAYRPGIGITFLITGRIANDNNNPISGVTVSARPGRSVTTDAMGVYTLALNAGVYTVTPSKSGYSFSPTRRIVELSQDVSNQNFVGVADAGAVAPFLDLPFNYGGDMQVFEKATRNWSDGGGWVQSWFDHKYPNYASNDATSIWTYRQTYAGDPRWQGSLLCYGAYCYDGHNGYDFDGNPAEIHAASNGTVVFVKTGCVKGTDCGDPYGNNVVVDHQNGYFTRYGHFASVSVSQGASVSSGDILGIMGSTGNSSGTHLHFSVHKDNGNGQWDGETIDKVVDPFEWQQDVPDPWVVDSGGPVSHRLWLHQVGDEKTFLGSEGSILQNAASTIQAEVPANAFDGQVTLELSPGPVAQSSAQLRSVGRGFWLRLLELLSLGGGGMQSQSVGTQSTNPFDPTRPITLTITYSDSEVRHFDESQLSLYHWDESQAVWEPLATTVDTLSNVVAGFTQELGEFDVQGPLLCPSDNTEPDDSYYSAPIISTDGISVTRWFDIPDDEDWVRFVAETDKTYEVSTGNLAAGVQTNLELYDIDGVSLLASDVDGGTAQLEWEAPLSGTYFVRVLPAGGSGTGCDASYSLAIAEKTQPSGGIYLPIILKNHP